MFKAFRIDEVFVMKRGKEAAPNRVPDGSYNMVNETSTNNGITKKAYSENVFDGNSITVSVNYATTVFYQPEPYCASVNILILENENLDAESAMYVIAMLRKNNQKYDYNHKISKDRLAETVLSYPVIENPNPDHEYTVDDIDWQYMRDRIAELERDRIAELERDRIAELDAYLKVTGLDDYTLTDEDKKILSNVTQHEFKEFKVKDVFDVSPVNRITEPNKSYIPDDEIIGQGGNTPYIAAISKNNGITGYSYREPNNMGDCVTLSTTAASPDTVFYQPDAFIGRQQMSAFRRKDGNPLRYGCGIYLATLVRKLTIGFNYGNKLTNDFLKNTTILLPVIESSDLNHEYTVDDIDWQYMEHYIRAMEKVAIADVVRYKDRVIEETRKLVS